MKARKALIVIYWKATAQSTRAKVLVLKTTDSRGGFWQSPTGSVEENESFAQAALREAQEETQLPFERLPQYLGLEYEFQGRWRIAVERAFFLPILGGSSPPTPIIDSKEHVEFEWLDPEKAIEKVKFPKNKEAIKRATQEITPIFLSKQGSFFQDGEEITHQRTKELLHRSIERDKNGLYKIKVGTDELDLFVEQTPRFVLSYDRASGVISLLHQEKEQLNPNTIQIQPDHSWICICSNGWPARFLSPAYYEITKDVQQNSQGEYIFHFLGKDYFIPVSH